MAAVIMSDYRKLESLAKRPVMRRQKEIITESRRPVSYSGQPLADNNNMVREFQGESHRLVLNQC